MRQERRVTRLDRHYLRTSADVAIDDVGFIETTQPLSSRHAEFRWANDELHVVDVGSLYGTYVNRELVESATLANGDEICIGRFRLVVLKSRND